MPLAVRGYSRDHRRDRPQVAYGLLCNREGCPAAVRAFQGNTADPSTLAEQAVNLRQRFGLQRMALVGDRGMIAQTRIDQDLKPEGLGWITALRHSTIRRLARKKHIQPGLFDRHDMAAVTSPDFPGERLLVCYNPLVAASAGTSATRCWTGPRATPWRWRPTTRPASTIATNSTAVWARSAGARQWH